MKLPFVSNLFKSSSPKTSLGLIIGSHAIKATIFTPPSELEENPNVLGRSIQIQGLTSMRGNQILDLDAILEITDLTIEQAKMGAGLDPPETFLGIFGAAVKAHGLSVKLRRSQKEVPIISKELSFLFEKIQEKTLPPAQQEITKNYQGAWQHLDTFLLQYRLDGKVVASPLTLSAEVFEASLIHTFMRTEDFKTWKTFAKELDLKVAAFFDSSLLWTLACLPKYEEGVIIDIGGDATGVVVFKNGKILDNWAYALGGRALTEEIAQKLNLSFDQAEETKKRYAQGMLDFERVSLIREILTKNLSFWVKGLEVTLQEFVKLTPIPALFLLTGGGSLLPEVQSTLLTHPWNKVLNMSAFPRIEKLDESMLLQGFVRLQELLDLYV